MLASNEYRIMALLLSTMTACTDEPAPSVQERIANAPPPAEVADPYDHSPSRFGVIPLHAGFSPDPRLVGGSAIGEVPAKTIHRKCKGWISEVPDYLLATDTAFFKLHLLGRSHSDVLLVVRKPNGEVRCNDNRRGTKDPMIRSTFPIGSTQVWVGVQEEGGTADYRLGFSEVHWKPSAVPLPGAD